MSAPKKAPAPLLEAPYRGIFPFRFVDSPIFFAREEETRKLLRSIIIYRGVLFYGDSGSGKSSLINAGLIPLIGEEGYVADRLRVQPRAGQEIVVERISENNDGLAPYLPSTFDDGSGAPRVVLPIKRFTERLRAVTAPPPPEAAAVGGPEESGAGFGAGPAAPRPLLIFDQFEELVTLFEESPPEKDIEEATRLQGEIIKMIAALLRDPSLPVKLLFVFREDYLAKLNKLFVLFPDLPDHYLRLTPLTKAALPRVVRGPFEEYPGGFPNPFSGEQVRALEEGLTKRSDSNSLNLSEVQIACLRLWQSADREAVLSKRGVSGLLVDYLSDSLDKLPADLRDPAVGLLSQLVTRSGTRNVVSEDSLLDRARKEEKIPEERARRALEALASEKVKLVRRERLRDTITYQIVSEFLVPWISRQKVIREKRRELRKAYRIAAISVGAAIALGIAAFYVWYIRTEAVAKDAQVKSLTEKNKLLEDERERLLRVAEGRGDIAADYATSVRQRDSALGQLAGLTVELERARGNVTTLTNRINTLEQGGGRLVVAAEIQEASKVSLVAYEALKGEYRDVQLDREGLRRKLEELTRTRLTSTPQPTPTPTSTVTPQPRPTSVPPPDARPPTPEPAPAGSYPELSEPENLRELLTRFPGGTGGLRLKVVDAYGRYPGEPVSVSLKHERIGGDDERKLEDKRISQDISVANLLGARGGGYKVKVKSDGYEEAGSRVTIRPGAETPSELKLYVDPDEVAGVEAEPYDRLPAHLREVLEASRISRTYGDRRGQALYDGLTDRHKAGLLNLYAKLNAVSLPGGSIFSRVKSLERLRDDAFLAEVDEGLLEEVRASNLFRGLRAIQDTRPGTELRPLAGGEVAVRLRDNDRENELYLTFYRNRATNKLYVDAYIHKAPRPLGTDINPYEIHNDLMRRQKIEPLYRLIPRLR